MSQAVQERIEDHHHEVRDPHERRRRIKSVVVLGIALALLVWFAIDGESETVTYVLGDRVSREFPPKELAAGPVAWGCVVVVAIALVLAALNMLRRQAVAVPVFIVSGLAFYVSDGRTIFAT